MKTDELIKNNRDEGITLEHNEFSDWTDREKDKTLNRHLNGTKRRKLTSGCGEGFWSKRGVCTPCASGCSECSSDSYCTECWTSNFTLKGGQCTCESGPLSSSGDDCDACATGTYYSITSQKCIKCASNCDECESKT